MPVHCVISEASDKCQPGIDLALAVAMVEQDYRVLCRYISQDVVKSKVPIVAGSLGPKVCTAAVTEWSA